MLKMKKKREREERIGKRYSWSWFKKNEQWKVSDKGMFENALDGWPPRKELIENLTIECVLKY